MSPAVLHVPVSQTLRLYRLNVEQYRQMVSGGVIPSGTPVELIGGYVVLKDRSARGQNAMGIGIDHATCVQMLSDLNLVLIPKGIHLRSQLPIEIPSDDVPEPDGVIVRGKTADYRGRHPNPADVLCLFEVAESSLQSDRTVKLSLYANAGVPVYVIANLPDRVLEVHSKPIPSSSAYSTSITLRPGDSLDLDFGTLGQFSIPVRDILP